MKETDKQTWNSTRLIAWLSLFVALIGGVPGIISIKNDLFKTMIEISYDKKNSFMGLLASNKKDRFGKKVICFYGMRFVGTGDAPTTIRNIQFYVIINGKWVEGKRITLMTNKVVDIKFPCLITGNTEGNFIIINWKNFIEYSGEYYVERGKTLPFDVAFMFDVPEDDITNSKKWKFVVTDHRSKEYSTTIDSPEINSFFSKNLLIFDCHLKQPSDIQELLQDRYLDYEKLHSFLQSRQNSKR